MTSSSDTPSGPPEGRYGPPRKGRNRRWPAWALGTLVLLAGIGISVAAYSNFGSAPIEGKAATFDVRDESVRITLEVRRDDPTRSAECVIRARGRSGKEVGRGEVRIPPGQPTAYHRTVLTTSAPPVTGEVFGCSYDVPRYLDPEERPSG
ncbi:DUF4307 domain-containing protein [Actinopolyspora halophila]|uniref:DUF4307 domain-containing protein n=1 Tax=Actinopolyspora halophila TaxID=1850 RepID=UPI000370846A|nr:DUF4307 domain-containing protein [Actinopolyspora halophila]